MRRRSSLSRPISDGASLQLLDSVLSIVSGGILSEIVAGLDGARGPPHQSLELVLSVTSTMPTMAPTASIAATR